MIRPAKSNAGVRLRTEPRQQLGGDSGDVMMADWCDCKLGDLLQIKHGFAFLGEHFASAGTHVVLTPGNFLEEGGFKEKSDKAKWYSGPIPSDYVLNKGDLIVAMTEQAEGLLRNAQQYSSMSTRVIPKGIRAFLRQLRERCRSASINCQGIGSAKPSPKPASESPTPAHDAWPLHLYAPVLHTLPQD